MSDKTPVSWIAATRTLSLPRQKRANGSGKNPYEHWHDRRLQATYPGRQVVSLSGDGGFAMLMGDFITLTQHKLPVKVVIFNNGTLAFVEMEMKVAGYLQTGVDLANPDFAAMARAMGVFSRRVEDPEDLEAAASEVFAHDGPALLDVVTNRQELAMPPKTRFAQELGFGLYALKAIMNGQGDDVIDLVRSNLFR